MTNHHVVEGATDVDVILHNGAEVSAKLLGSDVFTDLAVLEMDASRVEQVIDIGTSSTVKTGSPSLQSVIRWDFRDQSRKVSSAV